MNFDLRGVKSQNYKVTLQVSEVTWSVLGPGHAGKARTWVTPEQLQRCGWLHVLWQAVPNSQRGSISSMLFVTVRCYTTKENDRRISLYSIHTNPQNSAEHCLGGQDQYIR